jgi:CheY-like chemotaxis protein/signal transduction histidine kinase
MARSRKPDSVDQLQRIEQMRRGMLNFLLGAASLLGTVGVILVFVRAMIYGGSEQPWTLAVYAGAWLLVVVLFFARGIPDRLRALAFLGGLYGFSVFAFYSGWLANGGRVFLLALIVCTALLLNPRAGFGVAILSLLTYMAFGLAYHLKWIQLRQLADPTTLPPIAIEGVGFAITVGIITMGLWFVGRALALATQSVSDAQKTRQLLDQRAKELDESNQLLSERTASAEIASREADAARHTIEAEAWQATAQASLSQAMSGEQDFATLASNIIRQLCTALDAQVGVLFVMDADERTLRLLGSYAYSQRKHAKNHFQLGEGLVGQSALEKKTITFTNIPDDYLSATSALLQIKPSHIVVAPFLFDGKVGGVVELGLLQTPELVQMEFLDRALSNIGVAFNTTRTRQQINHLLMQTQEQAASLQAREEALQAINEELRAQSDSLRASQEQLREQQGALEATNAELEEQRSVLDQQNRNLKTAQLELQARTDELSVANKYKSEFLANMSHELRTPLNSLLILARMLSNNDEGNLTSEQVESARIIYQSGSDLLSLINEILDLSKVEAGRMTFNFMPISLSGLADNMRLVFAHMAQEKAVPFDISLSADLPEFVETDQQRVEQVVKNLLSNAFKFTEKGSVGLMIEREGDGVAIRVRDTGIGMTLEQQKRVFEAFQQADGSTSRKYGGTGLGLTISRELAARLGGKLSLESEFGKGSIFTLYLPLKQQTASANQQIGEPAAVSEVRQPPTASEQISTPPARSTLSVPPIPSSPPIHPDDRTSLQKGDKILLAVEDDTQFAKVLFDYAHKKDFKCLLSATGENGLELARQYHPDAIILDLKLPGMDGWQVLDALKQDSSLRHIPVHILSAQEETLDAYKRGALGFLSKPVSTEGLDSVFQKIGNFLARDIKSLLLIEDDSSLRHSVRQLLGGSDIKISEAASGQAALQALRAQSFDCVILDLTLPDMSGFDLLNATNQDETIAKCPVIVYTGKELSEKENAELLKYANSVIIKGIKSPERLLDETALFLHRVVADMPEEKQRTIKRLHSGDAVFQDKQILVVDDDMRNAFALSRLLSDKGLKVSIARSGQKALEMLAENAQFALVLMDIMMPEMDGYEAMTRIRQQDQFIDLPIIALTAKAMKGDRERCLEAGASDYLSKPVDADRLFSILRVWLYQG